METVSTKTDADQATLCEDKVTVAHINELIETNKALRESVISIAALLRDQTQSIVYPARAGNDLELPERSMLGQGFDRSRVLLASPNITSHRELRRRRHEDQWQQVEPMSLETIENERAHRKVSYEDRWTKSTVDIESEKHNDQYPTLFPYEDPWWDIVSCALREVPLVDQPQARKFDNSLHGGLYYELFVALFGSEFNYKWCSAPRAAFEESRRFRLGQVINKLLETGAVTYFGKDFARVLIETAEWTKVVWTRKPEGSPTLEALREHCYRRCILQQPTASEYQLVEEHNEGLVAIIYALDFRKWWNIGGPWQRVITELDADAIPLETLISHVDHLTGWTEKMRTRIHSQEPSKAMSVDPKELNSRACRDLGDITITWTSELELHLRLSLDGKRLYVFQYPTWLIGRRFTKGMSHYGSGAELESNKIFHDLAETYAILFGPSTVKEVTQLQKVLQNTECDVQFLGVPLWRSDPMAVSGKVHLHPEQTPARYFLDTFRGIDLPYNMEPAEGIELKRRTMGDVLRGGQPYPDDMSIMMLSILRYYPLSGSFNWSGSHFEEQLRILKAFMDDKKPRTIGQLWKDARDATSWWTFWAVLFFGVASILLAAGSLVVSIVQTVGTFQGLQ